MKIEESVENDNPEQEQLLVAGAYIDFEKITTSIESKKGEKVILNGINGYVSPGRLTALMGPSGSGKTSLLNILAGRTQKIKGLHMSGQISLNGTPVTNWSAYRRLCAYVEQDDLLFHTLTVTETLMLAAQLRLPRHMPFSEKRKKVDAVIAELGLKKCVNTRVGNAKVRGISGGERKRVSIALEILRNPSVLFLDECTSGLDSFQALRVVSSIKDLAKRGRTVVTSIHQPRSSIYNLFDDLIVLSEGKLMYFGTASEMVASMSALGHTIPKNYNPADFILDLVSVDVRNEALEAETKARVQRLGEAAENFVKPQSRAAQRAIRQKVRDPSQIVVPLVTSTFFGLILGFVYFQNGQNFAQNAIQDKAGMMFFIALNQSFNGLFSIVSTFPIEKNIVNRERSSKSYSVFPYYFSKVLADIPMLIFPFIFVTLAYWLAGFTPQAEPFLQLAFICLLAYMTAGSLGLVFSALMSSAEAAQGVAMPFMLIFALFSGFYANTELIPAALSWIQYISPIRWSFAAFMNIIMAGVVFTCPDPAKQGCIPTGEAFVERLGLSGDSFSRSAGILIGMTVFNQIVGYLVLRTKRANWVVPKQ